MCRRFGRRGLWWILLLGAIIAFEFTPLDIWVQDHFFDRASDRWWIDPHEPLGRTLFYTAPKAAIIGIGLILVAFIIGPARWRSWLIARGWRADRRQLTIALLAAGAVPAIVGALKNTSGVYCPSELMRYNGSAPYLRPFAAIIRGTSGGHCWPAGHASGGFALVALALLAVNQRQRATVATVAFTIGWAMGLYQILKGAHFVSHTLVTMYISLAVARFAAAFSGKRDERLTAVLRR